MQAPEINENGDIIPKMALLTSSPSPMQQANSSSTMEAKSKKKGGSGHNHHTNSSEETTSRPNVARGASTTSTASSGGADSEMNKTKRGLSKILLSARSNKSSSAASTVSLESSKEKSPTGSVKSPALSAIKADDAVPANDEDDDDGASVAGSFKTTKSVSDANRRIAFLTEQVSHHPPISSFFVECKEAGVELYGVDQLSAKFTGTSESTPAMLL